MIARALTHAAAAQPLLVVFDDLHWADVGSLALLDFVARQLGPTPLLVLATLAQRRPPSAPADSDCSRAFSVLETT